MNFELACLEDFNEIENLYWDLIDKSKEEPSFPDWEKGVHPSADFLMAGIVKKELFVLRDEGIIKACAIVNSNSNKEYKKVAWKVNERDNNVWIIHALAVRYEYRGMGLAIQLPAFPVKQDLSFLLPQLEALVTNALGVPSRARLVVTSRTTLMSDEKHKLETTRRRALILAGSTPAARIAALESQVQKLQAKLAAAEALLIQHL